MGAAPHPGGVRGGPIGYLTLPCTTSSNLNVFFTEFRTTIAYPLALVALVRPVPPG